MIFPAQAEVHGEPRRGLPIVLRVEAYDEPYEKVSGFLTVARLAESGMPSRNAPYALPISELVTELLNVYEPARLLAKTLEKYAVM